jgi:hypothetical protein
MLAVDWSSTQLTELDISSTELSEHALLAFFSVLPKLTYLAVPFCDGFTDQVILYFSIQYLSKRHFHFKVLNLLIDRGKLNGCRALDLSNTVNLSSETVHRLLTLAPKITERLEALSYTGHDAITEQFWIDSIRFLHRIK